MSLRVNPNFSSDFIADLQILNLQVSQDLRQLASGSSINSPSDDPTGAAILVQNQAQQSQIDQFQRNITDLTSVLQTGDSALNSATTALTQALSLGIEAGNSNLNSTDLQAIANQLIGIRNQMLGIANTSVSGNFIFAGTSVDTAPFVLDPTSASGVTYQGNTGANSIDLANGATAQINLPGNQIFANASGSVFGALTQLINAVQSGTGIPAANAALSQAFSVLTTQRLFYGSTIDEISSTSSFLNGESLQLSSQASSIGGADIPAVVASLSQAQTAQTALLATEGKALALPTLFDFLA
jgi:flagellar hook-associated protein 3 FlgL